MLVATTYKYVRILLASERIITHTSERSLLKNLGSWLGRLTIAQGQPVRHKDLDIKGIIIEGLRNRARWWQSCPLSTRSVNGSCDSLLPVL